MKIILSILFISTSIMGLAQKDITKEFKYANFIRYYNSAIKNHEKGDVSKAKNAIKNCRYSAKPLIAKGYKKVIQPKLDELSAIEKEIANGNSKSNNSSTKPTSTNNSTSTISKSDQDVTKEFKYESFMKSCKDAQSFYDEGMKTQAENSIKNARYSAKTLINNGFQSQIQKELDDLSNLETKINGEAQSAKLTYGNMRLVDNWLHAIENVYKFELISAESAFSRGDIKTGDKYNKNEVLSVISELKKTPEYGSSQSTSSNSSNNGSQADNYRAKKQSQTSSSSKGKINKVNIDKLERLINNIYESAINYNLLQKVGKLISSIENEQNNETLERNFSALKTLSELLITINSTDAYANKLKQVVEDLEFKKESILTRNKSYISSSYSDGKLSSLPKSAQKNEDLEKQILKNDAFMVGRGDLKNVIFIDSDWKIEKDASGNKFRRTLNIWLTSSQYAPYATVPNPCWAKNLIIVQYYTGKTWGKLLAGDNLGEKMLVPCTIIDDLYVLTSDVKVPNAMETDAVLSQKMISSLKKYGTDPKYATSGMTINSAILTTVGWGINRSDNNKILSKSRRVTFTMKDKNGNCYYESYLAIQYYNGSTYGPIKIETLGGQTVPTRVNCSQLK